MSKAFFDKSGNFVVEVNGETAAIIGRDFSEFPSQVKVEEVKIGGKDGPLLQKEAGTGALVNDGSAVGGGGGGLAWGGYLSDPFTAEVNKTYFVDASVTVTMPSSPSAGDQVGLTASPNVVLTFSGPVFDTSANQPTPAVLQNGAGLASSVILIYDDNDGGWFPTMVSGYVQGS